MFPGFLIEILIGAIVLAVVHQEAESAKRMAMERWYYCANQTCVE